nr:MAG TPA: Large subunit terminase [Caudoviricetes sp.]
MMNIKPQPGPQEQFLACSADVAIYGGAAGGGKTFALLLDALRWSGQPAFTGMIFRRTTPQIKNPGGLWDESVKLYTQVSGASPSASTLNWNFSSSARIKFSHLERDDDVYDHQGGQYAFIGFDELTHFTWKQFTYLLSRNRNAACGIKPYVRATTNPDADSWVASFIDWYIGEDGYPMPERAGKLRYFTILDDDVIWGNTREEVADKAGIEPQFVKSFTFIPASIEDNKILLQNDPGYLANLNTLPLVEKERLLRGNWRIKHAAGLIFHRSQVQFVEPNDAEVTAITLKRVRSWDLAATKITSDSPDPDRTAGVLMGYNGLSKDVYIIDLIHMAEQSSVVRKAITDAAEYDGHACTITIPQDPGQAGKDQADSIARELPRNKVVKVRPTKSKIVRSEPFASAWQNGRVKIVKGPWNVKLFTELEGFPDPNYHDDIVDACSDAYNFLVEKKKVYISAV